MKRYKVTTNNRHAVIGMVEKFHQSCVDKRHAYMYNGTPVFPFLTKTQTEKCIMYCPVITLVQIPVQSEDIVDFYGGNRIVIKKKHRISSTIVIQRVIPENPQIMDDIIHMLNCTEITDNTISGSQYLANLSLVESYLGKYVDIGFNPIKGRFVETKPKSAKI